MAYNQNTDAENLGSTQSDGMETVSAVPDVDEEAGAGDLEYSARSRSSAGSAPVFENAPDASSGSDNDYDDDADAPNTGAEAVEDDPYADAPPAEPKKKAGHKKSGERKKDRKKAKSARKSAKKRTPTDPKTAAREKKRKRRGIIAGTLVTVTAVALALVLALDMTGRSGLLTGPLGAILAPVQSAVSSVTSSLQEKINAFNYNIELERDLTAAEQELATINTKIARYDEVVAENERLRALMNNYEKYQQYEPMFARVIGKDMGNWFSNFTVDKGTSSGVTKGMTVMSADGVVGRVVEVGLNYAKVLTIIDGTSGVAVLIERNRDNGVVRGMVDDTTGENLLQMNYLLDINDVRAGDNVLTSGLDGVFPKGLPVGTVTQISRQTSGLSQYVVVTPYADFEHIEEVLLLKPQE